MCLKATQLTLSLHIAGTPWACPEFLENFLKKDCSVGADWLPLAEIMVVSWVGWGFWELSG